MMKGDCLSSFHPLVREWFSARYGNPTAVQEETWRRVAAGEHVLAIAPTGSGKTLAAFLNAISRLASGELDPARLSVLYVSPLKALNEDVRRNLELPLGELSALFRERGEPFPDIRAETRSGDTPESQRRRFLARPPAILCTTPESLAILLDSPRARPVLQGVRLVVLDEVHAVAGSKRGSLLAASVGRLCLLSGEFQRIALSATLRPPEAAAEYVGGLAMLRDASGRLLGYERRRVSVVAPATEKRIEFSVEWPRASPQPAGNPAEAGDRGSGSLVDESRYDAIIPAIAARLEGVRSLLVFTDSRRRAERMAFLLNELVGEGTAYAHHGSLAREARLVIEERFKSGELRCVVATASLELGIDIGSVDEVILAGAPPEVNAALQRAGRSGHGVGAVSRAVLYPFHGMDLLRSAAVVEGADARAVEAFKPPQSPLDILAQVILSMAAEREWQLDELYETICSFPPFVALARGLFDSTLQMLAGRYAPPEEPGAAAGPLRAPARLRELEPRVYIDAATGLVRARDGMRALLYTSGGAIPDRGHYSMRLAGSGQRIGELDEEFVYERKVGDAFTMGAQSWRIAGISAEAVEVVPEAAPSDFIPFWHAEARYRSPEVSSRLLALVDRLSRLSEEEGEKYLASSFHFSEEAARVAYRFVSAQKAAAGSSSALPGRRRVAVEACSSSDSSPGPSRRGAQAVVVHTLLGGAVNEPLSLALAAAFEEEGGLAPEVIADDDFVLVILPPGGSDSSPEDGAAYVASLLARLGPRARLLSLVRRRLEGSGLFGAQFRENAGRALLLPRGGFGKRSPLWITRLKAKRLFDAVSAFPDFPVTTETWRSCLADAFDMDALSDLVDGLASGRVEVSTFATRKPSPFAREALWRETGAYMYEGDAMKSGGSSSISDKVIEEALLSSRLRPRLSPSLIEDFERRQKRLIPGWGPDDPFELAEWVRERVLVPASELSAICGSGAAGLADALAADPGVGGRLVRITLPGASEEALVHAERRDELVAEPGSFFAEWLRHEALVGRERMAGLFGLSPDAQASLLSDLVDEGIVVVDDFRGSGGRTELVDAENLEILLRLARRAARAVVEARPANELFRLVSSIQGLAVGGGGDPREGAGGDLQAGAGGDLQAGAGGEQERALLARLGASLDSLSGFALPPRLWEADILPARLPRYAPRHLDSLLESEPRLWYGAGRESLAFARAEELEWLCPSSPPSRLLPADGAFLDFWEIKKRSGEAKSRAVALELWKEAWAGSVSSEGYDAMRQGITGRFGALLPDAEADSAAGGKPGFGGARRLPMAMRERWKAGAPVHGRWFSLELESRPGEEDALEREEAATARVRILLARYGLLCRGILEREAPAFRWGALFPAMRRMELAGELVFGRFFEGLDGPQFMGQEAFELYKRLGGGEPGTDGASALPVWLSVLDPAAQPAWLVPAPSRPSGWLDPPDRLAGNRLAIMDGFVAATLTRAGTELVLAPAIRAGTGREPGDVASGSSSAVLGGLARQRSRMDRKLVLKRVNGIEAARSPEAQALMDLGFEADRGSLVLW
jgi:ATP-dependent Lhr-like helicase